MRMGCFPSLLKHPSPHNATDKFVAGLAEVSVRQQTRDIVGSFAQAFSLRNRDDFMLARHLSDMPSLTRQFARNSRRMV